MFYQLHLFRLADSTLSHAVFNNTFFALSRTAPKIDISESPYACACRVAHEEIGVLLAPVNLHLTDLISEHGYQGQMHWLMFLFEVKKKLTALPPVRFHQKVRLHFGGAVQLCADIYESLESPVVDKRPSLALCHESF